jgi:hypothetical protein
MSYHLTGFRYSKFVLEKKLSNSRILDTGNSAAQFQLQ